MSTSRRSPRILYVAEGWAHGAQVRGLNVLRALREIGTVEVVMLGDGHRVHDPILEVSREAKVAYTLETPSLPKKGLVAKLTWTFEPRSHYPYGCGVGEEGTHQLVRSHAEFDLSWFFKLRSVDMFPNMVWQRSVVDIDDVQSTYERATLRVAGPLDRLKALRALFVWRRRERLLGDRFNVLTVCSEQDRDYLRRLGVDAPIHVIPNGFEKPHAEPFRRPAAPPRVGFIGAFSHHPNREGVSWFVKKCWPHVKREVPDARLRLIGRESDKFPELSGPDVDLLGHLPDTSDEIQTWSAMVVPIRLGAGTRVKVAHGFSQKCPIVSTSLGALGYGAVDGREMYLADSADAFSSACIKAIRDPEEARQMAQRAWVEFLNKWTWDAIRPRVWAAVDDCLRSNSR